MRRWAIALAVFATLVFPLAGVADDVGGDDAGGEAVEGTGAEASAEDADAAAPDEDASAEAEDDEEEDEEEPTAFDEYLASVVERTLTGLNGLITAPADPPMAAIDPPKALDEAGTARHPLGFASGILLMGYRTLTGAVDFGLALLPKLPVLSPVPRYHVIPGFEHEDE